MNSSERRDDIHAKLGAERKFFDGNDGFTIKKKWANEGE